MIFYQDLLSYSFFIRSIVIHPLYHFCKMMVHYWQMA